MTDRPTIDIEAIHRAQMAEEPFELEPDCGFCGAPEDFTSEDCPVCQGEMTMADIEEEDRRAYEAAVMAGF